MSDAGMPSPNRTAVLSYLAGARAQVETAQEAVEAGDLLRAAACLKDAGVLQQEAVAALVTQCWQNALNGARDGTQQHREEALALVCELATAVLGSLCRECRQIVSDRFQTGDGS